MKIKNLLVTFGLALSVGIGVAAGLGAKSEVREARAEAAPFSVATRDIYLDVGVYIEEADYGHHYWSEGGSRFAVYYFINAGGGYEQNEAWTDMNQLGESSIYKATIPDNASAIFCRMNGADTENKWANKWHQSQNITDFSCGLFYVNSWSGVGSHWYNLRVNNVYVTGLKVDESNPGEVYAGDLEVNKGDAITIWYNNNASASVIGLGTNDKASNNINSSFIVKHGGTFRFSMSRTWTNAWLSGYDGGDATLEGFCNTLLSKTASCATANWNDVVSAWDAIKNTASGTTFKDAVPSFGDDVEYSSVVIEAKTRYAHMRTKYSVAALDGVTLSSKIVVDNPVAEVSNNAAIIAIIVISAVAVLALGGYFFVRSRKED